MDQDAVAVLRLEAVRRIHTGQCQSEQFMLPWLSAGARRLATFGALYHNSRRLAGRRPLVPQT